MMKAPAEVKELVAPGERILAWATGDRGLVVATQDGLYLPELGPTAWVNIHRAAWDEPVLEIVIGSRTHREVLNVANGVPAIVFDRVTASVLLEHYVQLFSDGGARLIARRTPGAERVTWRVVFDAGLDPTDPRVRAAADEALAELRRQTGL